MRKLGLKILILGKFGVEIETLSTHDLFCQKCAVSVRILLEISSVTVCSCPAYFSNF